MDLPLLGIQGGEFQGAGYTPHVVDSLDTTLSAAAIASRKSDVPPGVLRAYRVNLDDIPDRVVVLGRVDFYGASPCKCGEMTSTQVYFAGADPVRNNDSVSHVRQMSAEVFLRLYESAQEFAQPRVGTLRELLS